MKAIRSIKTSETTSLVTQSHIPQDLNTQTKKQFVRFSIFTAGLLEKGKVPDVNGPGQCYGLDDARI
jgi:hypothetical protein